MFGAQFQFQLGKDGDDIRGASLCFRPSGKVIGLFVWMY